MATTRERLHQLLDALPDGRLDEASLVIALLSVPDDDEPTTAEDDAALARGRRAYLRGETIPDEIVARELRELAG